MGLVTGNDRYAVEVAGAHRRSFERNDPATFEDAVENCLGGIGVVQNAAPLGERLVGGEDRGAGALVALVDGVEEKIGGVGAVGEISEFIDSD